MSAQLSAAVRTGECSKVKQLLEQQEEPLNAKQLSRYLRVATLNGHPEVAATLLDAGAQVDCADSNGVTPLLSSIQSERPVELVQLLLDRGAFIESSDATGTVPLHVAVFFGKLPIIDLLLQGSLSHVAECRTRGKGPSFTRGEARSVTCGKGLLFSSE
ncbi:hypothetical protein CYMTET_14956 [Cymbomonas tetramitiformis]|uniref:Uncharacterized protein n=1 Tax=Cymbomonas tetramitiformis TaxID=36881 RepID=A0AAE0GF04_9CHLO|nr:hypothetical protein CYMTET_14956 [Cymbomonas tetramitiformis]